MGAREAAAGATPPAAAPTPTGTTAQVAVPRFPLVSEALIFEIGGKRALLLRTNASVTKIIKALGPGAAGQIETVEPRPDALRLHGGDKILIVFRDGTDAEAITDIIARL